MPRTTEEAHAERRKSLAEWVTAVISIFWSVWWGFFLNEIWRASTTTGGLQVPLLDPPVSIQISKETYLAASGIVVSFYAYTYAHWLWNAQKAAYHRTLLSDFVHSLSGLAVVLTILLGSIAIAGSIFSIPSTLLHYGFVLTLLWPIVVIVTIWTE